MNEIITPTLDKIERVLPPVTRRMFRLNRAVTAASFDVIQGTGQAVAQAVKDVSKTAFTGAKTVQGQTESVARRVATTATNGLREVTGQAGAQAIRTLDSAEEEVIGLLDETTPASIDRPTGSYKSWTKAELYERAKELDIDGRSAMSKSELVKALKPA